jgi:hypothetical protein
MSTPLGVKLGTYLVVNLDPRDELVYLSCMYEYERTWTLGVKIYPYVHP